MLKLSKSKLEVKRRVPFNAKRIDSEEVDAKTVYVERFPCQLTEEQIAIIFKKAGKLMNISRPHAEKSLHHQGFCFLEFQSSAEAENCVRVFNNSIP
mmetsp:Transcript_15395/g.11200  ORF Transcript_15395/g.11200 Transcript_15395/m.11200 type:complete len:97 (+) Transcript_15395:384-674(+)